MDWGATPRRGVGRGGQGQILQMAPLLGAAQADPSCAAARTCEQLLRELSQANRAIFHRNPAMRHPPPPPPTPSDRLQLPPWYASQHDSRGVQLPDVGVPGIAGVQPASGERACKGSREV